MYKYKYKMNIIFEILCIKFKITLRLKMRQMGIFHYKIYKYKMNTKYRITLHPKRRFPPSLEGSATSPLQAQVHDTRIGTSSDQDYDHHHIKIITIYDDDCIKKM